MGRLAFGLAVGVLVVGQEGRVLAQACFNVDGERGELVMLCTSLDVQASRMDRNPLADTPMGRIAGGVARTLREPEFGRFATCIVAQLPAQHPPPEFAEETFAFVVVVRGRSSAEFRVSRTIDGRLRMDPAFKADGGRSYWLDAERFYALIGERRSYFDCRDSNGHAVPEPLGDGVVRECLLLPWGHIRVDRSTLGHRFFKGMDSPPPAGFHLNEERYSQRLPVDGTPLKPAGLLLWLGPTDDGVVPESLKPVADELGLVLVSPHKCGNDRPVGDRLELALFAVGMTMSGTNIDARRVYVAGLSGGGKIATILHAGCSDVFSGCVPIVGTGWRRDIRISAGQSWPRIVGKPATGVLEELRTKRIAPITGPRDFNHEPVLAFADQMKDDGLPVRVFDVPGLGHEMPSEQTLREAILWIDEPWRVVREREVQRGKELMKEFLAENKPEWPRTRKARGLLQRMTGEAPWTEESWQAIEWLESAARIEGWEWK